MGRGCGVKKGMEPQCTKMLRNANFCHSPFHPP
jgi:hypothetical protein